MKLNSLLILFLITSMTVYCQKKYANVAGRYTDGSTTLVLNADSSFELQVRDPIPHFRYSNHIYASSGVYTMAENVVTLNPQLEKRHPRVSLIEKEVEGKDSMQIKVNYLVEEYDNEVLVATRPDSVEMMTLYINKIRANLVYGPVMTGCLPKIRHQVMMDYLNTTKFTKIDVKRFAFFTYGFDDYVELIPTNPNSNYYEITIVQPVDKDRRPRNKKVIFKGRQAYYYEYNGRVRTSWLWNPLEKERK